jgi:predicted nucleic acid-binding protein
VTGYVDTSVLLRVLLGEAEPLAQWSEIEQAYASRLLVLEVARTIDRYRLRGVIDDEQVAQLHSEARRVVRSIHLLGVTDELLDRAERPMPTVVGSLDAIHLVTAVELARTLTEPLVFATHDIQLARAARASGLDVAGA